MAKRTEHLNPKAGELETVEVPKGKTPDFIAKIEGAVFIYGDQPQADSQYAAVQTALAQFADRLEEVGITGFSFNSRLLQICPPQLQKRQGPQLPLAKPPQILQ